MSINQTKNMKKQEIKMSSENIEELTTLSSIDFGKMKKEASSRNSKNGSDIMKTAVKDLKEIILKIVNLEGDSNIIFVSQNDPKNSRDSINVIQWDPDKYINYDGYHCHYTNIVRSQNYETEDNIKSNKFIESLNDSIQREFKYPITFGFTSIFDKKKKKKDGKYPILFYTIYAQWKNPNRNKAFNLFEKEILNIVNSEDNNIIENTKNNSSENKVVVKSWNDETDFIEIEDCKFSYSNIFFSQNYYDKKSGKRKNHLIENLSKNSNGNLFFYPKKTSEGNYSIFASWNNDNLLEKANKVLLSKIKKIIFAEENNLIAKTMKDSTENKVAIYSWNDSTDLIENFSHSNIIFSQNFYDKKLGKRKNKFIENLINSTNGELFFFIKKNEERCYSIYASWKY